MMNDTGETSGNGSRGIWVRMLDIEGTVLRALDAVWTLKDDQLTKLEDWPFLERSM